MSTDFIRRAFEFYRQMGYQPHQAAALAGNAAWESNGRTDIRGDGGKALGLFQWHPDRQDNLNKFATQYGLDPKSEATQLQFADWELKNTESAAGNKLLAANDLKTANDAVLSYLRPSGFTPDNPMGGHGYVGRFNNAAGLLNVAPMAQTLSMPPSQNAGPGAGGNGTLAQSEPGTGSAFDPNDPYGRTKGDADMAGYGGSPKLPDPPSRTPNYAGVMAAGNSLMQMGMPSGPSGPSWAPQQSQVGRGNPQLAGLLTEIFKRRGGGLLGGF